MVWQLRMLKEMPQPKHYIVFGKKGFKGSSFMGRISVQYIKDLLRLNLILAEA